MDGFRIYMVRVETYKRSVNFCKHSVKTHFPKDRNCGICKRTKITKAPCRRRTGEAVPRGEKFGDVITAEHKSSTKDVNLRTITDTLSWHKFSPLSGIRVKPKLQKRWRRICESSYSRRRSQSYSYVHFSKFSKFL